MYRFGGLTIFVCGRVSYFEALSFFVEEIKLVQIDSAVGSQYFLLADIGIFEDTERKSSYGIGSDRGNINKSSQKKPAGLDKYPCNQRSLDDA